MAADTEMVVPVVVIIGGILYFLSGQYGVTASISTIGGVAAVAAIGYMVFDKFM